MSHGERLAWPPSGAGCESMIRCCEALARDRSLVLVCLFSALTHERDCAEMLQTVHAIVKEQGKELPPVCKSP